MLGKTFDFPIRKDSEKKLRDFQQRFKINLQIFGELLFNLGLNAIKVDPNLRWHLGCKLHPF